MSIRQSHLIHLTIDTPFSRVSEFLTEPSNFPKWAAVQGPMVRLSTFEWKAQTEFGERIVRFSPPNEFGVFDHAVYRIGERPIMMPMRVIANEEACDLTFLFWRRAAVSDEEFASAIEWVTSDFLRLRTMLEALPRRPSV